MKMNTKSLHTISIWQVIDMPKRKMVQNNLLKNSISAYFAAIEIHNKPNFSYRYETVTLLIMNAWELILKCFVKKYIKSKSIYKKTVIQFPLIKQLIIQTRILTSRSQKRL